MALNRKENKITNKYVERLFDITPRERKKRFGEKDLFFDGGNLILRDEGFNNLIAIELDRKEAEELKRLLRRVRK